MNQFSPLSIGKSTIFLSSVPEGLVDTGISIFGSTPNGAFELPIFMTQWAASNPTRCWNELYFPEKLSPIEYWACALDKKDHESCAMIRLQCLLYEFHLISDGSVNIESLLIELVDTLGMTGDCILTPEASTIELHPIVADANYFVSYVSSHSRELSITLSKWITPKIQPCSDCARILVNQIYFRPTHHKKLNEGKWSDWESYNLYRLFWEEFKKFGFKNPVEIFTEKGKADLLNYFEWTKLSLMSKQEARAARVEHIRNHAHLVKNLDKLALSLKLAELYSVNTSVSQIKKFLPSLLKEAFHTKGDS